MPGLIKFVCLLSMVAAMTISGWAQKVFGPEGQNGRIADDIGVIAEEVLTPERQRALRFLDQLLPAAQELKNQTARIHSQMRIAEMLWRYDKPRARQLFTEALRNLSTSSELPAEDDAAIVSTSRQQRLELSRQLLSRLALLDPELAGQLADECGGKECQTALRWEIEQRLSPAEQGNSAMLTIDAGNLPQAANQPESDIDWFNELARQPLLSNQTGHPNLPDQPGDQKDGANLEILLAFMTGEFDRALSLIERIPDQSLRLRLDAMARAQAVLAALNQEDFALTRISANGISDPIQRVVVLIEMAQRLVKKNDFRAFEILDEATELAKRAVKMSDRASAYLLIAEVMVQLDPIRSFNTLRATLESLNQAEKLQQGVGLTFETAPLEAIFTHLAHSDFERVWELTQTIEKPETALLIQLALCQSVLARQGTQPSPTPE